LTQRGGPYTQSVDDGVGLYRCELHESLGMNGGFVVVESAGNATFLR
jgi:plastocyanin